MQIILSFPRNKIDTQKGKNTARWEGKKKKKRKAKKKESVPWAPKTTSTSTVIDTAAVHISSGREAAPAHAGLHVQAVTHTLMDYHRT